MKWLGVQTIVPHRVRSVAAGYEPQPRHLVLARLPACSRNRDENPSSWANFGLATLHTFFLLFFLLFLLLSQKPYPMPPSYPPHRSSYCIPTPSPPHPSYLFLPPLSFSLLSSSGLPAIQLLLRSDGRRQDDMSNAEGNMPTVSGLSRKLGESVEIHSRGKC